MAETREAFVGIDGAKLRNTVVVADAGRDGEVDASPESMRRLASKLAGKYQRLYFCYEAGPTGYGLQRLLTGLGHSRVVVARHWSRESRETGSRPQATGDATRSDPKAGLHPSSSPGCKPGPTMKSGHPTPPG